MEIVVLDHNRNKYQLKQLEFDTNGAVRYMLVMDLDGNEINVSNFSDYILTFHYKS